jgi:nicotinamide-nucleotide amidase
MKFLMVENVLPYLHERYQLGIIKAHVLRTAGIGESMLDDLIGHELLEQSNPTIGLAAHSGQVDVRITAKADSVEEADLMIAEVEAQLRARIGDNIFGVNDETLEQALVSLMKERGLTLALSEIGIVGAVSEQISKVENGKDVLTQVESFANPSELRASLGLGEDAKLRDLAQAAVERISEQSGAKACIAVVSRPDVNEAADSEEGTAVVTYVSGQSRARVYGFGGRSDTVRPWVSMWTLSMAWRMLKEQSDVEPVR